MSNGVNCLCGFCTCGAPRKYKVTITGVTTCGDPCNSCGDYDGTFIVDLWEETMDRCEWRLYDDGDPCGFANGLQKIIVLTMEQGADCKVKWVLNYTHCTSWYAPWTAE